MPIQIDHLYFTYLKNTSMQVDALKDVNLSINEGEFIALVGETGSGKSTLVQHLNGLLLPSEGTVKIDDYVITNKKRHNKHIKDIRKKVGLIFQFPEYQLFEETVEKDVAFGPKNFGVSEEEAIKIAHKYLKLVGIKESYFKRSPFELSGGERRKVAIAGILALENDILILDEPTSGLDRPSSKEIMNIVDKLHKQGKTIMIVTHDMYLVMKYASRVILMKDGKVEYNGDPITAFTNKIIEPPELMDFILKLNSRGYDIPLDKIHSAKDLFPYLIRK